MECPNLEKTNPPSVELVELSEQTKPLLQRKDPAVEPSQTEDHQTSETISGVFEVEDHNEIKEAPLDSPTVTTTNTSVGLTPDSESRKLSQSSSPVSAGPPFYSGSIPKNRKRPGSTSDSQQRVTMTGTVTRGVSVGQPVEVSLV